MTRRVTLTDVDGEHVHVAAEHVAAVVRMLAGRPACGAEVRLTAGQPILVRESADEVAALVWPERWQETIDDPVGTKHDVAPKGFAPIGAWEPIGISGDSSNVIDTLWRRPLRRIPGGAP